MNNEIINAILKRRQSLQIDQKSLAELAGISVHALSDLESGKGNPTLSTLMKVLSTLGLTLNVQVMEPGDA
jgi:transcriptional regulator with XRE-family HTH domain